MSSSRAAAEMENVMPPRAEVCFEVPFHDVDMMGVVWYGHYYKYFELARTALFRQFNCDGTRLHDLGYLLPVIDSHCRYIAPLTYGLGVRVTAILVEIEYRIKITYLLSNASTGDRLARGSTIQVAVKRDSFELCYVIPRVISGCFQGAPCGS
jgi:acyl-CoA thioester hydrolase